MSKNSDRLIRKEHYITSPFGAFRTNGTHNGVDYGVNMLDNVMCYFPCDMEILRIGIDRYGGTFMYALSRKLSKVVLFYHNQTFDFKVGEQVRRGQEVGLVGNRGKQPMGIHQHFSLIRYNSRSLKYYSADYLDYERYVFPITDYDRVQAKYGFNDETMAYLNKYLYNEELFIIMLKDSGYQRYSLLTVEYILDYEYGVDVFDKL